MKPRKRVVVVWLGVLALSTAAVAKDYFLTLGGGNTPANNQASLERNVLFFQRLLQHKGVEGAVHDIYFADGSGPAKDLQVIDAGRLPKANRLMAEFFGSEDDLGIYYRDHAVTPVRGATTPSEVRAWFRDVGSRMLRGDRLILYVTAHGEESVDDDRPYETSILLWDDQRMAVKEVVQLLDGLAEGTSVVAVMVQCHAGGFARFIYEDADPDRGLSAQPRCGFFATLHDRIAAGCTAEIDETTYVEYSTYFWEALGGVTRTGEPIESPDYDGDGVISFSEAHAYTIIKADTIDMPIKTSGEFLEVESRFRSDGDRGLLDSNESYATVFELADSSERAILTALSAQLSLSGEGRIQTARDQVEEARRNRRRRFRGRRGGRPEERWRREIARDIEERWPALANTINPEVIELLTSRSAEFVEAIEQHPRYDRYRADVKRAAERPDPAKQRAKLDRFVRTAENVILRENLKRLGDRANLRRYEAIRAAEGDTL